MSAPNYTTVREVMTATPHIIDGLATVREAMDLMRREQVSSLVVDHRYEGDEYGLVVVHDIAEKVIAADLSPDRANVYEIMSKPVVSFDAKMDIKFAIRMLTRFRLSRALVTEGGELAGIVTLRDMVFRFVPPAGGKKKASKRKG